MNYVRTCWCAMGCDKNIIHRLLIILHTGWESRKSYVFKRYLKGNCLCYRRQNRKGGGLK